MHPAGIALVALPDALDHHLAQVDADAVAQGRFVRPHRITKGLLELQGEEHGIGRPREHQEERVARRADLGRLGELGQQTPNRLMMFLDPPDPEPVTQPLLELGGPHQVGEHERHQPGLMLSTEGLDPAFAAGIKGLGIHGSQRMTIMGVSCCFFEQSLIKKTFSST